MARNLILVTHNTDEFGFYIHLGEVFGGKYYLLPIGPYMGGKEFGLFQRLLIEAPFAECLVKEQSPVESHHIVRAAEY